MTREELEKVIQHFKSLRIIQRESFMREGFDVAIKALEQESVIDSVIESAYKTGYEMGRSITMIESVR